MNSIRTSIFRDALQVSPTRIAAMDDNELNLLMADILPAHAYKCNSPVEDVRVNTEGKATDNGCDGWTAEPKTPDKWFGSTDTCWQFKAGKAGEPNRLKGEVAKSIPKKTLIDSGRFVVVASGSKNGKKGEGDRLKVLVREATRAKIPSPNIVVIGSEGLALWCNEHPAIAAHWAGRPAGLWTREDWFTSEEHQVPWQASAAIEVEIEARRADLDFATGAVYHLHIYGPPGVGKTRFALELCRKAAWNTAVIYIRQATDVRLLELIDSAVAEPDVRLIVVADEVQAEQLRPLRDSVGRGNGRIRLITIGHSPSPEPTRIPALLVKPLEAEFMGHVIKGWYPAMPSEHVEFVVRFADGFVRLARLAADAVAQDPTMNVRGLLSRDEIRWFLDRMLGTGDRRALYVVAVLTSVGWSDDKQAEGELIAKQFSLNWNDVRGTVEEFHRRFGIAPQGGRYRYISPTPLGIHLAVEAWTTFTDIMKALPSMLPSEEARDAYYDRLQSMASNPQAQQYARDELAFFFRIDDFIDARAVRRWAAISTADPATAAQNLVGALSGTSLEERSHIRDNARRQMVWALVRLAWRPSSFHDSVKSLALLAEAENEAWANNATAEFIARFQISLGGTAVPYLDRLPVLDELLEENRSSITKLLVKALAQVSEQHAFRLVSSRLSDELPKLEWQPHTTTERLKCVEAAISKLNSIANYGIPDIEDDLVIAAEKLVMMLRQSEIRTPVVNFYETIRRKYPNARESLRRAIAKIVDSERKYWKALPAEDIQELDTIHSRFEDSSLNARLQQYVGPGSWDPEEKPDLRPIAKELLLAPEVLIEAWPWLTSGQAQSAWILGEALATIDSDGKLSKVLPSIPTGGYDMRLLCSYVGIQRRNFGEKWYDEWFTSQFERNPKPIPILFEVAWRCGATEAVASMIASILHDTKVEPRIVGQLGFSPWGTNLTAEKLEDVLRAMLESGHWGTTIAILESRMKSVSYERERWAPLALELVTTSGLIRDRNVMVNHYWKEVALLIVPTHAKEVCEAILRVQADRNSEFWFAEYSEATNILVACAEKDPGGVWQAMQPYLSSLAKARAFTTGFPRGILEHMPIADMLSWISESPQERAEIVAGLAQKDISSDEALLARIIGDYGDNERVAETIFADYISGSWSGPASLHWQELAIALDEVAKRTAFSKLHRWASKSANSLREMSDRDRQMEEEENLGRR